MTATLVPQFGNPRTLLDGSNCGAATGAGLVGFASAKHPTASGFRSHMLDANGHPDVSGGTNPVQLADTALRVYGVRMDVEYGADFDAAWALSNRHDRAVGFAISYGPVSGTQFDGSPGFRTNHQLWRSGGLVFDPLADGRRPGIPTGPDDWSMALLKNASAKLNVASAGDIERGITYRALGWGRAYIVTAIAPTVRPSRYSVRFTPGSFWAYSVAGGVIVGRQAWRFHTEPWTSAPCNAPEPVPFAGKRVLRDSKGNLIESTARRLVQVTKGALNGRYVEPGSAHVELVRRAL